MIRSYIFLFVVLLTCQAIAQSPVERHGLLKVSNANVVNEADEKISLPGMSLFWSNNGWGGDKFYNHKVVKQLKNDWNVSIVRASMGVEHPGGYLQRPDDQFQKITRIIEACIREGLYVIVDWHSHKAEDSTPHAVKFFKKIASTYGQHKNIIYEIYNEPLNVSWTKVVKPYAIEVIAAIRSIDPDNLIVVGSPNWCQDIDVAAKNPITSFDNIAYSVHFYASSHKQKLRNKVLKAMNNGLPIFITEWGTTEYTGDGKIDEESVATWVNFMKKHGISACNWSLNDKKENASALKRGTKPEVDWTEKNFTKSGKIVRSYISNWNK